MKKLLLILTATLLSFAVPADQILVGGTSTRMETLPAIDAFVASVVAIQLDTNHTHSAYIPYADPRFVNDPLTNASAFEASGSIPAHDSTNSAHVTLFSGKVNTNDARVVNALTNAAAFEVVGASAAHDATNAAHSALFALKSDTNHAHVAVYTVTGSAPTNDSPAMVPLVVYPLQGMTCGTNGGESVTATIIVPSGDAVAGQSIEVWVTANAESVIDFSSYVIPATVTNTSPITIPVGKTYIFKFTKSLSTQWWLQDLSGGF